MAGWLKVLNSLDEKTDQKRCIKNKQISRTMDILAGLRW